MADTDLSPVPADYRGGIESDGLQTEYLINRHDDSYTPSLRCIGEDRTGHREYHTRHLKHLLPTGSEEREVFGVGSIPAAIFPSCQYWIIIAPI